VKENKMGLVKGCLAKIGCLTVLALAGGAAWIYRSDLSDWWTRLDEAQLSGTPSEQLAVRAEDKLAEVARASGPREVRLSGTEVQSLLIYRVLPRLGGAVREPVVQLTDSSAVVTGRLDLSRLGTFGGVDALRRLLPDSAKVTAEVVPTLSGPGEVRLEVLALEAGGLPIPSLMIPSILKEVSPSGVRTEGRSLFVPVPDRVRRLRVRAGSLELATGGP